jgi:hypothetical protein
MHTKLTVQCASFVAALIGSTASAFGAAPSFKRHDQRHEHEEQDHYRDQGAHPHEVRGPGVALQSRALLDKAGNTEFELTTGQLDSAALPPGNINEIKLRAKRPEGQREFEKEFEHLRQGGYAHYQLKGLVHNDLLNVRAEVGVESNRGVENNRGEEGHGEEGHQDVNLKLQDVVRYRPDVAVQKLDYPPVARPGTAVQFSATIAERMGDLGAHADCVLLVDGKQVDVASGIWVDAASVVTCRWSYSFSTSGLHTVAARIQNAVPGDYDPSNNEVGGQIQIQNPALIFYSSSAFESTTLTDKVVDTYASGLATVPDKHQHDSSTQSSQGRYFSGQIPSALNLPLKNVGYSDSSGGSALMAVNYSGLAADSTSPSTDPAYTTVSLIQRYDDTTQGWMTLQIYKNAATGAGLTTVDWSWDAGDVTYHSDGYCKSTAGGYRCVGGDYTLNFNNTATSGVRVALAANYSANVAVDDGTAYSAQPSMDLVSTPSTSTSQPLTCVRQPTGGPGMGKICTQSSTTSTSKSGNTARLQ